jgi:two-component system NtrC family sensor kinase
MIDNITERKKAEQTLRESESRFRKLFQDHSASLMVIDPDTGNISDANPAAAEFYGLTPFLRRIREMAETSSVEELLRMTLDEAVRLTQSVIGFAFFVAQDQNSLSLQACSTNTGDFGCHAEVQRPHHYPLDKDGVWADAVRERRAIIHNDSSSFNHHKKSFEGYAEVQRELVVPVIRDNRIAAIMSIGNKSGYYDENDLKRVDVLANLAWDIVSKKITEEEQEKLEYQLQHSRKIEMVGQLAAGIAHEINNPLNIIALNFANIQEANADLQAIVRISICCRKTCRRNIL